MSQDIRISPPQGCTMEGDPTDQACTVTQADGSLLTVMLARSVHPVSNLPANVRRALEDAPEEWMGENLLYHERKTSDRPPTPSQRRLVTRQWLVPPDELPPGTDVCLRYDMDFSDELFQQGRVQLDNSGLWCNALRADVLYFIQLEVLSFHEETGRRLSGFVVTAERVLSSLRVDW